MKIGDRVAAAVLLGLCVWFLTLSAGFSPYSALFPRTIVVILGLLALALLVVSFVRPEEGSVFGALPSTYLPIAMSGGLMVGWLVFINVLGFLVSSLLFFALITVFLDDQRTARAILSRIGIVWAITAGFYLFFAQLLMVPFPRGALL